MDISRSLSEDEVIAEFLHGEFTSDRFGDAIRIQLYERKLPDSIITSLMLPTTRKTMTAWLY